MLAHSDMSRASLSRLNHDDEREFHAMVWVTFFFLLPVALVSRLLPRPLRPLGANQLRRSAVAEAWEAASIAISYAFMR